MKVITLLFCTLLWVSPLTAQYTFTKTFGGERDDKALAAIQSRTGEFIVCGLTFSYGKGKSDIWLMKLNTRGQEVWKNFLGSHDFDWANDLIETRDGNYVIVGYTQHPRTGNNNAWVISVDRNGQVRWSRTFGGDNGDEAKSVIQTRDGKLAVVGLSESEVKGKSDIWLLKMDVNGNEYWQKTYGGKEADRGSALIENAHGDLIIAGYTESLGKGKSDLLLMKVDAQGREIWTKNYGGNGNEAAEDIIANEHGNFVVAGWTSSGKSNSLDALAMEINEEGQRIWTRTFGGRGNDAFYGLAPTFDGQYLLVGASNSNAEETSNIWFKRLNKKGGEMWEETIKGTKNDYGYSIMQTLDGGFLVAGGTNSFSVGGSDIWVLKANRYGQFDNEPQITGIPVVPGRRPPEPPFGPSQSTDTPTNTEDYFKPNLYILAVGVSYFKDPNINLTFAHTDALSLVKKFSEMEGKIFRQVKAKTLTNEEASLTNIKLGISWLEREATQKDLILVFISSHGALDNKGNLYILPHDFNSYNLFATALNIKDLTEGMNGTPTKKLILLDACHSGQSAFDLLEFATAKSLDLNKVVKEIVDKEPGVTVMTSSSGKEFSYENPQWGHGAFTLAMLEGLGGKADYNRNSVINLSELNLYITERVKNLTKGRQHPYTPINLFGDIPLFVLD